jgi:hypothetical protein
MLLKVTFWLTLDELFRGVMVPAAGGEFAAKALKGKNNKERAINVANENFLIRK